MTGRWPANVILSPSMADALDGQSGSSKSPTTTRTSTRSVDANHTYGKGLKDQGATFDIEGYADQGGASRFFLNAGYETWELEWIYTVGLRPCGAE